MFINNEQVDIVLALVLGAVGLYGVLSYPAVPSETRSPQLRARVRVR